MGRLRILLAVAALSGLLAGCAGVLPMPTAITPSNACGGFHLKVVNGTSGAVRVALGGGWSLVVPAGSTQTFVEYGPPFDPPGKPPMPWTVVIASVGTGETLFRATMVPPIDQKVVLGQGAPVQTPYDLSEGC